jgi:16S rRNA (adenine1518-N6/adenine1519-N6)-dimethyltransferase
LNGGGSFRPKKSLGQNFLIDPIHQTRIVASAHLARSDAVLEIGAGDGSLTALIAAQAGRVVAVELDERLIPGLEERFKAQPHVIIVHGDILGMDPGDLMLGKSSPAARAAFPSPGPDLSYKVVANLPYYITANAIRKLLECTSPPSLLVLTIQREVADRIVAMPPNMSVLAIGVQFYCTVEIVDRIPAGAFRPSPKIDSAVVRLERRNEPLFPFLDNAHFFAVVRAGFAHPRKQLRNSLAIGLGVSASRAEDSLLQAGILPQRRAETLTLAEWGRLSEAVPAG